MKIILANGLELNPIIVTGGGKFVNGQKRDTLNFVFSADTSLEYIDSVFTDSNCENIKVYDFVTNEDGTQTETEHIHTGYMIRAGLSRTPITVQPATEVAPNVIEERVVVSMAQRTYSEAQLSSLTETVDALVYDSLMAE